MHIDGCDFRTAVATLAGTETRPIAATKPQQRDTSQTAQWLWSQRQPITEDTPPALYLRKRGYAGTIPATLGYLPGRDTHPPAMIAAFCLDSQSVNGVHVTRLTADGDKAAIEKPKIMLGRCKGSPIVVAPPNDLLGMAITEGIEDALSVVATGLGVWAAGSAGMMPALASVIPSYIECVTVYGHDDEAGKRHANELIEALQKRGIEVWFEI
jgi:Toprim domain